MEWISVGKEMPEEIVDVIVCVIFSYSHGKSAYPWILSGWHSESSKTGWYIQTVAEIDPTEVVVSHWMPMPKPPTQ